MSRVPASQALNGVGPRGAASTPALPDPLRVAWERAADGKGTHGGCPGRRTGRPAGQRRQGRKPGQRRGEARGTKRGLQLSPAVGSLERCGPTSQGTAWPPCPWPSSGAEGRGGGLQIHHLPRGPSAPAHDLTANLALEITFLFSPNFPSKGQAPNSPQAAHGGLFRWPSVLRCRAETLRPRLGEWGWPARSLTLARPRGRGRLRGEWQRGEGAG